MLQKVRSIEKSMYKKIKSKFDSLSDKNKNMLKLFPKITVYMIILIYLSGFIKTISGVLWFSIIAIFLGVLVFFIKI
jgi:hypothetical protein